MITYTYRYKLKPTKQQIRQFEQYLDICRSVSNYAHAERKAWLESRKSRVDCCSIVSEYIIPANTPFPSYNIQAKALTEAKNKLPHLKLVNAQCLQQVLKRLDKAWNDFFKIPQRGFPRFRSKNRFRSFVFPQLGKNCLDQGKVKLPSIGWVRIRQSRPYPVGFEPKQFQIVRKASGYYLMISFQSSKKVPDPIPGKTSIGLDAGIESFVATPTELIKSPKFLRSKLRTLKLLQRRLKKKIKGSNNWLKLQSKIARFHEKVANTRRDWLFKLAHYICDQANNIFGEDINFKSWSKGMFCRQSLDSGIGSFINKILPFVCWKRDRFYLKVEQNFSSQECSNCGAFTGKKQLKERVHHCQFCHHTESRDTNSAKILMQRGQVAVGHTVTRGLQAGDAGSPDSPSKIACGGDATGFRQLSLFELVGSQ
ncbi:transposase [Pleurocapsales cyanobacterium LEGE 06147]|nr:transposase [Pleurocapsales cyanobacterium LEGE 06147]